jgi:hypothetical protein
MVKNEDVCPHPPPSPIPSLTPWSTGWRPGIRKGSLQLGYGLPKQVNDSLGVQETASRIPSRRTFWEYRELACVQGTDFEVGLFSDCGDSFGFLKRFWAIAVLGSSCKCACVFWPSFSGCLREGDLQLCQEHNKGITLIGSSMGHSKRRPSCNSHRFQVQAGCIIHLSQVLLSPSFLLLFFFPAVWASCSFPVLLNR